MNTQLAALLADVFGVRPGEITIDADRETIGNWDSLRQMDLVVTLEREYPIVLDVPDIIRMRSIRDIVDVLREKGVKLED